MLHMFLFWKVIAFTMFSFYESKGNTLPEVKYSDSACYGIVGKTAIHASCDDSEIIAVKGVFAGSKMTSVGCKSINDDNRTTAYRDTCCTLNNEEDCILSFENENIDITYKTQTSCTGLHSCPTSIRTAWMKAYAQCSVDHMIYTNYMYVDYYCIPEGRVTGCNIADMMNDGNGSALYIYSPSYPDDILSSLSTCSCRLETDYDSTISVYAVDVRLGSDMYLRVSDTNGSSATVIQNNNFEITLVYQSQSRSISINFTNVFSNNGGQFWLSFIPSNNGKLALVCPFSSTTLIGCQSNITETTSLSTSTPVSFPTLSDTPATVNGTIDTTPDISSTEIALTTNDPSTFTSVEVNSTSTSATYATNTTFTDVTLENTNSTDKISTIADISDYVSIDNNITRTESTSTITAFDVTSTITTSTDLDETHDPSSNNYSISEGYSMNTTVTDITSYEYYSISTVSMTTTPSQITSSEDYSTSTVSTDTTDTEITSSEDYSTNISSTNTTETNISLPNRYSTSLAATNTSTDITSSEDYSTSSATSKTTATDITSDVYSTNKSTTIMDATNFYSSDMTPSAVSSESTTSTKTTEIGTVQSNDYSKHSSVNSAETNFTLSPFSPTTTAASNTAETNVTSVDDDSTNTGSNDTGKANTTSSSIYSTSTASTNKTEVNIMSSPIYSTSTASTNKVEANITSSAIYSTITASTNKVEANVTPSDVYPSSTAFTDIFSKPVNNTTISFETSGNIQTNATITGLSTENVSNNDANFTTQQTYNEPDLWWIAIIVVALLTLIILAVIIYYKMFRKTRKIKNQDHPEIIDQEYGMQTYRTDKTFTQPNIDLKASFKTESAYNFNFENTDCFKESKSIYPRVLPPVEEKVKRIKEIGNGKEKKANAGRETMVTKEVQKGDNALDAISVNERITECWKVRDEVEKNEIQSKTVNGEATEVSCGTGTRVINVSESKTHQEKSNIVRTSKSSRFQIPKKSIDNNFANGYKNIIRNIEEGATIQENTNIDSNTRTPLPKQNQKSCTDTHEVEEGMYYTIKSSIYQDRHDAVTKQKENKRIINQDQNDVLTKQNQNKSTINQDQPNTLTKGKVNNSTIKHEDTSTILNKVKSDTLQEYGIGKQYKSGSDDTKCITDAKENRHRRGINQRNPDGKQKTSAIDSKRSVGDRKPESNGRIKRRDNKTEECFVLDGRYAPPTLDLFSLSNEISHMEESQKMKKTKQQDRDRNDAIGLSDVYD